MEKVKLILIPIQILFAILIALCTSWIFIDSVNISDLFVKLSYLFAISISIGFSLGILMSLLKIKWIMYSIIMFFGNLSFAFSPLLLNITSFYNFAKTLCIILFSFILFLMSVDLLKAPDSSPKDRKTIITFFLSKIFILSILALASSILFGETKFSIIGLISLIVGFILTEIKRFVSINRYPNYNGNDIILESYYRKISNLKKEIDNNSSLIKALQLQLELSSNLKKEISSRTEFIKQKITNDIASIEEYNSKYTIIEENINQIIANYSTHLLSIEYYLSKLKDSTNLIRKTFTSSYTKISSKIEKKPEIMNTFNNTKPIMDSLLSKIDSIVELLSNIIITQTSISGNINKIFEELVDLSVISTNIEIESFRGNTTKTMRTINSEINTINSNIKAYSNEIINLFNKSKELFDYLSITSKSLLKHSDNIKYNVLLAGKEIEDIFNMFNEEILGFYDLDQKLNEIDNLISSISSQVREFREFLEKISNIISFTSEIKETLEKIKVSLNDIFIIVEDLQQNAFES
ncbi:MAG: hypothetical protein ACK4F9_00360 [Brevinematia bacterium]